MIVVDVEAHYARACPAPLSLISGRQIRYRLSWLVKPGDPVWHYEE